MNKPPNKLQAIFDAIDDFLFVLDLNGRILELNPTAAEQLGYSRAELLGESILLLHPPERHTEAAAVLADIVAGKRDDCTVPLLTRDQKSIPVETKISRTKWGDQDVLIGISRDITKRKRVEDELTAYREHLEELVQERTKKLEAEIIERKQAEAALRESEERFSAAFHHNGVALAITTTEGRWTEVNQAFCALVGYTRDEVIGKTSAELGLVDASIRREILNRERSNGSTQNVEVAMRDRNGKLHTIQVSAETILLNGVPHRITTNVDITERRQAEEKLRESEDRFHSLFENAVDAMLITAPDGGILAANPAACRMFGWTEQELIDGGRGMTVDASDPRLPALLQERQETGKAHGELTHIRRDGTKFEGEITSALFSNKHGDLRTGTIVRDVTKRKQAEDALISAKTFLDRVVDLSPFAMWVSDKDGTIIRTNRSLGEAINLTDEVILNRYNIFQDENMEAEGVLPLIRAVFERRQPARFTIPWKAAQAGDATFGEARDMVIDVSMFPIVNAQNELTNVVCQWIDITEQKRAEQQLIESEERLALVMEGSQLGFWDWNIKTGEVRRNARWAEMLGYTLPEVEFNVKQWTDLHHPDDKAAAWQSIQDHLEGRTAAHRMEYRMRCKNGEYKWILDQARVVERDAQGKPLRMSGTHTDITERKRAEEVLRINEARYRMAQTIGHVGNWEYNIQTTEFWGSPEAKRIYGFDPGLENFTTEEVESCIPDRERVHQALVDLIEAGKPYNLEFEIHPKNSSHPKIIISIAELQRDEHGQPFKVAGVIQDITERKKAEEALRQSEAKYRTLFENMMQGVFYQRADGVLIDYNEATLKLFGLTADQFIGRTSLDPCWKVIHEDGSEFPGEQHPSMQALQTGQPILGVTAGVFNPQKADYVWLSVDAIPQFRAGEEKPYQVFVTLNDITERKKAEEALRQSHRHLEDTLAKLKETQEQVLHQERLAAVGQLAAGIAHDFNNILTGILGFTELLQRSPDTPEAMQPSLEKIASSGQRAARLVRQLLDFSRKTIRHPKHFALDSLLKEQVAFLRRAIPENIDIKLTVAPGDYLIEADPIQLQQVITNLAVNAKDAMPSGGKLEIKLSRLETSGQENCAICSQPFAGKWLGLTVADTGSGIPAETMQHIFEPFFTTKTVGKGTGLGLAQVAGIVEQHCGHITVNSRVDRGTTFTVYLLAASKPNGEQKAETPPMMLSGQGQTILLVEDEAAVVDTIKALLEHLDYRVITAANGREALAVYRAHQVEIALVLSDMMMPDMDGEALFQALTAEIPDPRMVLMSGYPLDEKGAALLAQGVVAWLEKPISFGQLSQAVSQALSNKTGRWG